ncbi:MAG: UvrD-helicase domain-containing protein, partial [Chloroflexi bacterium]|nr:UvrD-helicase domain-containing protein [Chloroflexota bacterium]
MTIADQAARERVERSLNDTLFVEAGAGTGKTEALVRRIVSLIANGDVRANQIAAITFTEKAAAELYDRVLERIDERRLEETDPQLQQR